MKGLFHRRICCRIHELLAFHKGQQEKTSSSLGCGKVRTLVRRALTRALILDQDLFFPSFVNCNCSNLF